MPIKISCYIKWFLDMHETNVWNEDDWPEYMTSDPKIIIREPFVYDVALMLNEWTVPLRIAQIFLEEDF